MMSCHVCGNPGEPSVAFGDVFVLCEAHCDEVADAYKRTVAGSSEELRIQVTRLPRQVLDPLVDLVERALRASVQ